MELINPTVGAMRRDAREQPEAFWGKAAEKLPWFRRWDQVLDWQPPTFRWFVGGLTNLSHNCLDVHVEHGRGGHAALIHEDERGTRQTFTYAQALHWVKRYAAALRARGIGKGDRVAVYMPTCPEAVLLMLAITRIGAVHLVVFAGFGAGALGDRIRMSGAKAVFTADVTWRKGKEVRLKEIVDAALADGQHDVRNVVVLRRGGSGTPASGLDVEWHDFLAAGAGGDASQVAMESNEPAFILATSGTTAKPKLAVHTHGGYQVHVRAMADWMFGLNRSDVWWSTSDIGWIVGHSYIVYAPLMVGATSISYEGALDHPGPQTFYRVCEENRVTGVFTSPTAARMLMRYGSDEARAFDLSAVQRVFCAGEVLNPPAWEWLQREVFDNRIPVVDHMWQTETSGPIIGNPYGLGLLPIKPGSSGIPLPGIEAEIVTLEGEPVPAGEKGIMVIRRPFPGLTATLWGEPERYGRDYWGRIPGLQVYSTGDAATIDQDGYVWFSGRADEIIKIAAHRIGTIECETAFLRHPSVAEAGVTGRPDEIRGEVISAFVVLRQGHEPSEALRQELLDTIRRELGPVAVVGDLNFVRMLPKTRSGKIMRRVLKAVTLNADPGDISTIEDEGSVEDAREAWRQMRESVEAQVR